MITPHMKYIMLLILILELVQEAVGRSNLITPALGTIMITDPQVKLA